MTTSFHEQILELKKSEIPDRVKRVCYATLLDAGKDELGFLKSWVKNNKDKYFRNNAFLEAEERIT